MEKLKNNIVVKYTVGSTIITLIAICVPEQNPLLLRKFLYSVVELFPDSAFSSLFLFRLIGCGGI